MPSLWLPFADGASVAPASERRPRLAGVAASATAEATLFGCLRVDAVVETLLDGWAAGAGLADRVRRPLDDVSTGFAAAVVVVVAVARDGRVTRVTSPSNCCSFLASSKSPRSWSDSCCCCVRRGRVVVVALLCFCTLYDELLPFAWRCVVDAVGFCVGAAATVAAVAVRADLRVLSACGGGGACRLAAAAAVAAGFLLAAAAFLAGAGFALLAAATAAVFAFDRLNSAATAENSFCSSSAVERDTKQKADVCGGLRGRSGLKTLRAGARMVVFEAAAT